MTFRQAANDPRIVPGEMRRGEEGRLNMGQRQKRHDALQAIMTDLQLTNGIDLESIFQGHVELLDVKTQQDGGLHKLDSLMM